MALIQCPECSREISNLSKVCIHCGYPILPEGVAQQVELTGVNFKSQKIVFRRTLMFICVAIVLVCIAFLYQKNKEFNLEKTISTSYGEIVEAMTYAELTTNLTYETWSSAISGRSDFNIALKNLYKEKSMATLTSYISKAGDSVDLLYAKILKYENANSSFYADYISLYNQFKRIVRFSVSPEGSLQTYGQERRKLFDDYKALRDKVSPRIHKEIVTMSWGDWLVAKYK